jgi:hypothetical protein
MGKSVQSKFLNIINGIITQVEAIVSSTGAGDANKIPRTGADGRLDNSFLPTGIGADTKIMPAIEALAAGDMVNVFLDAGVAKER